jgi:RNA polymerase sigma-70 factor (ECF subfamily)
LPDSSDAKAADGTVGASADQDLRPLRDMNDANASEPGVTHARDDLSDTADGELVRLARAGDSAAVDCLIRRHADRLLRMVRNLTANREDAEDVTQDALAAAFFKLDSFAERSSFFTWLYRIALNKAISKRRLRRIETTHHGRNLEDAPPPVDHAPATLGRLEQEEELERMRTAISHLEPERRKALVLRDVDGLDYGEIAKILNIPVGTVRSRLHRARCDLKVLLDQNFASGEGDVSQ